MRQGQENLRRVSQLTIRRKRQLIISKLWCQMEVNIVSYYSKEVIFDMLPRSSTVGTQSKRTEVYRNKMDPHSTVIAKKNFHN